ncbi:BnaC04g32820D [Brassica napus]|uniref:BnaC04g32820D protein n=1 Tax=Brassica napus TaxID=3708 RepID=A0A078HG32_BRANA|nr:BnaC04g32820D [Brassica napus]
MGESAVLFHSYSFGAPSLSRNETHQDNTKHALSQSVSFGRFATENLEWGKWSSFSHKKYVDEAEKYSQPGSVAQKKAFFDAHYKKIAESKKAKASLDESKQQQQPESVAVLLNTLETLTKDEVKEEESGETELVKEEPETKCVVVVLEQEDVVVGSSLAEPVSEDDLQAVVDVLDEREEDEELLKKSSPVEEKEEERKFVTNKSSVFPSETPDKAMELVVTQKLSEDSIKKNEKSVRPRFSFLKLLMGSTKAQRQNSKKRTDKKPNKPFLCLCFNPEMVRETEGPTKTMERNISEDKDRLFSAGFKALRKVCPQDSRIFECTVAKQLEYHKFVLYL